MTQVKNKRISIRLYEEDFNRINYWTEAFDMDRTELILEAVDHYIKKRNGDYDLPTAEIQRLNQMVDIVDSIAVSNQNLERTIINGFDAILGMSKGVNYLVDEEEDGEL